MHTGNEALEALFVSTLRDIYDAEKQVLKALPKMARAATSAELRDAFRHHREETEDQVERLEQVFGMLGSRVSGRRCEAIRGIVEEGDEAMQEYAGTPALDAGIIAAAQTVEHYEINRYRALQRWAGRLGMDEAADLFGASLREEEQADRLLTRLAEGGANDRAKEGDSGGTARNATSAAAGKAPTGRGASGAAGSGGSTGDDAGPARTTRS